MLSAEGAGFRADSESIPDSVSVQTKLINNPVRRTAAALLKRKALLSPFDLFCMYLSKSGVFKRGRLIFR